MTKPRPQPGPSAGPAWWGDFDDTGAESPDTPDGPAPAEAETPEPEPEPATLPVVVAMATRHRARPLPRVPRVRPPRVRPSRNTRPPHTGLAGLILIASISAFLAWVSAEPLWFAIGHAETGTATVTRCTGSGVNRRCTGTFAARDFTRAAVPVMGDAPAPGRTATARMTSERGTRAYLGAGAGRRAAVGLALLVLCGFGIAWVTGARRLPTGRGRLVATALSFAGPFLLLAGMLGVTF
jgi:hypothetical protein